MASELQLHSENESAWLIAFLVMPTMAQDAWRSLADRIGVDLRCLAGVGFHSLTAHHRDFPDDPAVDEILAMGREEVQRRAN